MRNSVRQGLLSVGRASYGCPVVHDFTGRHRPAVTIGNYCSIADGVHILIEANHRSEGFTTFPILERLPDIGSRTNTNVEDGPAHIGHDVWIGFGATIVGGRRIGDGAVVAARAVVTRDVRPFAIVAGVPAREIRRRFDDETCDRLQALRWWDCSESDVLNLAPFLTGAPDLDALTAALSSLRRAT